jgi:hypothetical protein
LLKSIDVLCICIVLTAIEMGAIGMAAPAFSDDAVPIGGNYTQNVKCKGDGSDAADTKVTITDKDITSNVGVCAILNKTNDGKTIDAHVECQLAGGPMIGDITLTLQPDKTVRFLDRDGTYSAILYKCPE